MSLLKNMSSIELCRNAWKVFPSMPPLPSALDSPSTPVSPVIKDLFSSLGVETDAAILWLCIGVGFKTKQDSSWQHHLLKSFHSDLHKAAHSEVPKKPTGHFNSPINKNSWSSWSWSLTIVFSCLPHANMPFRTINTSTRQVGFWLPAC